MKRQYRKVGSLRSTTGAAFLNEFAPALFLLFIGIFFPLIDFVSLGLVYGCGFTLNYFQSLQCASVTKTEAADPSGLVKFGIPQQWKNNGLGKFVELVGDPETNIAYKDGQLETNGVQDMNVVLSTTITTKPLICVPTLPGIPGLTAPITFNFVSERPMENPDDANK